MDIASALKNLRSKHGLSQYRLAKISGVSQSIISSVESGGREPTLSVLERLCISMDIRLSDFVAIAAGESTDMRERVSTVVDKLEQLDVSDQKIVELLVDSLYAKAHGDNEKSSQNVGQYPP